MEIQFGQLSSKEHDELLVQIKCASKERDAGFQEFSGTPEVELTQSGYVLSCSIQAAKAIKKVCKGRAERAERSGSSQMKEINERFVRQINSALN